MKRIIATGAVAALAMVGLAGTASAEGNGKAFQECFGVSYGQSGLAFLLLTAQTGPSPSPASPDVPRLTA